MKRLPTIAALVLGAFVAISASAEDAPTDDALFAGALAALKDGRTNDAIADLESLGDRGVVDPVVSFDRGLAYALRVRAGAEQPGDLGRAAHGFEETRELALDDTLTRDAVSALSTVRAEVARRRSQAGEPVEVDPGVPLRRAVTSLASDDAWALAALVAGIVLGGALFVRGLSTARRVRIAAAIALAGSGPALVAFALLALFARDDRLHLREGVIVAASARLSDERHIVLPNASPLPEAARVTLGATSPGWAEVRWGKQSGWVPSQTVRPIAKRE